MVVMIGGIANLWMSKPLILPKIRATTTAITNAVTIDPPYLRQRVMLVYSEMVAIAAKDISIPPEISTRRTPIAKIPVKEVLFNRSNIFSKVKKLGLMIVIKVLNNTIMINT